MANGVYGVTGPTVQPRVVTVHSHEIEPVQTRFPNTADRIAWATKQRSEAVHGRNVQVRYTLFYKNLFYKNMRLKNVKILRIC